MGLLKYKTKRNLAKSKEPPPKLKKTKGGELRFVVQEHAARRLHYDLRLEVGGVLKAWAVPKGPSTNPREKRLAIMVEDHPYDYQFFEGVIPEGYGAGTVKIWDKGTYHVEDYSPSESEKLMKQGLKNGEVHFILEGKKLRGEFALVKFSGRGKDNEWLLIKKKDKGEKKEKQVKSKGSDKSTFAVGKQKVDLKNLDKIFWPKEKITKGELIEYYIKVAPYLLPYLKDRPQTMVRFPDGIEGTHFYQKNLVDHPSWVKTTSVTHKGKTTHYLVVNNLESLLYAVNLGCIEFHPFLSHIKTIGSPDFLVFDLDPEATTFANVVKVAQEIHNVLEELSIPSFCKTSGATGLHICVPLKGKHTYEEAKDFALSIANIVHQRIPKITSLERMPQKRQGKVYLDCFQNNQGQTIAAPYSVRARP